MGKKMNKTIKDFQEQVEKLNITRWNIHDCSICWYPCGFIFENGLVFYDSGCDCVNHINIQPRPWEDVAEQYNMQSHEKAIDNYNKFWGFDN